MTASTGPSVGCAGGPSAGCAGRWANTSASPSHGQPGAAAELLHVLVVEDSEDDARLVVRHLQKAGLELDYSRVDTLESMEAALNRKPWDIVIADYSMPHFSGIAALELTFQHDPDLPFILVSGAIGEETAVQAMKAGAHDYVMKDNLTRLVPAVERELHDAEVRRAGRAAEEALRESEELHRTLVETSPDGIALMNPDGVILTANQRMAELHGRPSPSDVIGANYQDLVAEEDQRRLRAFLHGIVDGTGPTIREYHLRRLDGTIFPGETHASLHLDSHGRPKAILIIERGGLPRPPSPCQPRRDRPRTRQPIHADLSRAVPIDGRDQQAAHRMGQRGQLQSLGLTPFDA